MNTKIKYTIIAIIVCCFNSVCFADDAPKSKAGKTSYTVEEQQAINKGLEWLVSQQRRAGHWIGPNGRYPVAMTALSGIALSCEGSTTTQGKYSMNIRRAIDYLVAQSQPNGLIGSPQDDRYIYGHGFAMLFLSQALGEEEDADRRVNLIDVLSRAVIFSGQAQTSNGGWGYVSAKEGSDFDEGSTTITQVQGLRGCRNAGIPVPKEIIDKAVSYIHKCTKDDGGVIYSLKSGGGGRPAITAAAVACLLNAGEYDDSCVPKQLDYCRKNLDNLSNSGMGYWHYAHYYYAQVKYRTGGEEWDKYRGEITKKLLAEMQSNGCWNQGGYNGPVMTTAINLTILQLNKGLLPIYQR